ncbi:threonine synthase [Lecanora helva]
MSTTASQRYLSTRGGSSGLSFENVVLKGLAEDGGLFIPEQIPSLPSDWSSRWRDYSYEQLAYEIFSLYLNSSEIPENDLKDIISRSYSTFRTKEISPLVLLDQRKDLYLLELFHGVSYSFKDVALQMLGNLFEYFLVRKNHGKAGQPRDHLTIIGATSGDTGSAAIYGLRGKADLSIFMLHPEGKVSDVQAAQMTTVLDSNVHNVSIEGTFDDCQDIVKALFADAQINRTHKLGAVNSINWARILAQMVYYFYSYFSLLRSPGYDDTKGIRYVVPSGNFGDILAGWFAKKMGLPCSRLSIATNQNDILHRFMTTGTYAKKPVHGIDANGGMPEDGVKADPSGVQMTLSPAMDILVSSNFERLLAFLAFDFYSGKSNPDMKTKLHIGRSQVTQWLQDLKTTGGFAVDPAILAAAQEDFSSERVNDTETIHMIQLAYAAFFPKISNSEGTTGKTGGYILDPHSAVGIAASLRTPSSTEHTISLATAHPAKFAAAVDEALHEKDGFDFDKVKPKQLKDLESMPRKVEAIGRDNAFKKVKSLIIERIPASGNV